MSAFVVSIASWQMVQMLSLLTGLFTGLVFTKSILGDNASVLAQPAPQPAPPVTGVLVGLSSLDGTYPGGNVISAGVAVAKSESAVVP